MSALLVALWFLTVLVISFWERILAQLPVVFHKGDFPMASSDSKGYAAEYRKVRKIFDSMLSNGLENTPEAHKTRNLLISYWNKMKAPEQKEISKLYIG